MAVDHCTALAIARKVLRSVRHCGTWANERGDVYPVNIKDVDLAKIIEETVIRKPNENKIATRHARSRQLSHRSSARR